MTSGSISGHLAGGRLAGCLFTCQGASSTREGMHKQANGSLCRQLRTRGSQCGGDVDGRHTRGHTTGPLLRDPPRPTRQPPPWRSPFLIWVVRSVKGRWQHCSQSYFPSEIGAKSSAPKVLRTQVRLQVLNSSQCAHYVHAVSEYLTDIYLHKNPRREGSNASSPETWTSLRRPWSFSALWALGPTPLLGRFSSPASECDLTRGVRW